MHELPTALEDVSRRFSSIDAHYTILIDSDDEGSNEDMWASSMENKTTERISGKISLAVEHKLRCQSIPSYFHGA